MTAGGPCATCGAALARAAKFCGACGAATTAHRARVRSEHARTASVERRHALALALAFGGALLGMLGASRVLGEDTSEAASLGAAFVAQVAAGAAALAVLGRGSLRASFAGRPTLALMLVAVPVGAVALGVAVGWVEVLERAFAEADGLPLVDPTEGAPASLVWSLALVLGAPLVEEWLDRGVVWRALAPLTTVRGQVVVSATLFALAHGLNGGFLLELPHRFVGGLALGALRARSGSLLPSLVAHMTWNGLALAIGA